MRLEGLDKYNNIINIIGSCTRVLPAYSIVPQSLHYQTNKQTNSVALSQRTNYTD
jgi:hypothetical protein